MSSVVDPSGEDVGLDLAEHWSPDHVDRARRLHAQSLRAMKVPLALVARYFNVAESTIKRWVNDVPESCQRGGR